MEPVFLMKNETVIVLEKSGAIVNVLYILPGLWALPVLSQYKQVSEHGSNGREEEMQLLK